MNKTKINIAFLAPPEGIGGGNRKFSIYYNHLSDKYFNKWYLYIHKNPDAYIDVGGGQYVIGTNKIINFIKKNRIDFFYACRPISLSLFTQIKKISYILKNVNGVVAYSSDKKVINLAISKVQYLQLKCIYPVLNNTFVVYNPIEINKWHKLSKKITSLYRKRLLNKKLIIGRLGRAEPNKWDFLIISTLRELDKQANYSYGYVFAGIPLLYRIALKLLLSKRMQNSIICLPELKEDRDIAQFYKTLDLFWQTSQAGESFGNVIAEAFCFGIPVMSDYKDFFKNNGRINIKVCNAQSELVDHGINGMICNYPSKIIEFLGNTDIRNLKIMGWRGFNKVKKKYDAKTAGMTMAKTLYSILRQNNQIKKNAKLEKLKKIPSDSEVLTYDLEYQHLLEKEIKANQVKQSEFLKYKIEEKIWHSIELVYLCIRKTLKRLSIDIEKTKAFQT